MLLVPTALLTTALAMDIRLNGELSFDMKISDVDLSDGAGGDGRKVEAGGAVPRTNVTAAPVLECLYQYPESRQLDTILSTMMNALTKVFVRGGELALAEARRAARAGARGSRFRVVDKKNTTFFEAIYANMTDEYMQYYNGSLGRVQRSGADPCLHQEDVKREWRHILDSASRLLRNAAYRCVNEYLSPGSDPALRARLHALLDRELGRIRSAQLDLLCDQHQLCYNELLL